MNQDKSYDNCRFSVHLAALVVQQCPADEDWVIKPIGVVNNLCSLLEMVDHVTQTKLLQLVDTNSASARTEKKQSAIRRFFSMQHEELDCIYVSSDCQVDEDLNEKTKTQLDTKLQVVDRYLVPRPTICQFGLPPAPVRPATVTRPNWCCTTPLGVLVSGTATSIASLSYRFTCKSRRRRKRLF